MQVYNAEQRDRLARAVRRVLNELGYLVQHDELRQKLLDRGCGTAPNGRVTFPDGLIDEFVADQTRRVTERAKRSAAAPTDPPEGGLRTPRLSFGNLCPKYFDPATGQAQPARRNHLDDLAKFAHIEQRIGGIALPLSLTDCPPQLASIEGFLRLFELTDKAGSSVEPFYPEVVPFLAELSDIFLGPDQYDRFIDHCNCINPICRLEHRTAGVMLERAKLGVTSMMTSMPAAGGNGPITVDGSVVQGSAEIAGGVLISWILNPEANNQGYISSGVMDFRTATTSQSAPESVLIDVGCVEVMDHAFGGNTRIGGRTYVAATAPGLQATFEKAVKALAYARLGAGGGYAGCGVLDNGATLSPQQLLLDLDANTALASLWRDTSAGADLDRTVDFILDVARSGSNDFLSHDQTLELYRQAVWEPNLLTRGAHRSEADLLADAADRYRNAIESYPGHQPDEDKLAAGRAVLERARRELDKLA